MNIIVIALATAIVVAAYKFGRLTKGMELKNEIKKHTSN